jgi:hypothetical protein
MGTAVPAPVVFLATIAVGTGPFFPEDGFFLAGMQVYLG